MRQLVDQDEIVAAGQRRNDAGVGEIAGAEHAGRLGALEPREPRFELGVQRMVAGDEARGAGADAVSCDRLDRRGLQSRVLGQIRDNRCRRTTADGGRSASTQMPSVRGGLGQRATQMRALRARRACRFANSSSDGMFGDRSTSAQVAMEWRRSDRPAWLTRAGHTSGCPTRR